MRLTNTFFRRILIALSVVVPTLVLGCVLVVLADSGPPWVYGVGDLDYTEQNLWVRLDTSVTVSPTTGVDNFTGGYVEIDIVTNTTTADSLRLVSGTALTVSGTSVYWNGTVIGSIDASRDGQNGNPLRINFFSPLPNSGFETGDLSGWIVNDSYPGVAGEPWVQRTTGDSDPATDDHAWISQSADVQSTTVCQGDYALRLRINGSVDEGYGTAHGPEITSTAPFEASPGDSVSVNWYAQAGSDDYDVYGFVYNADTDETQVLFYDTGDTTGDWVETTTPLTTTGSNLYFRFLHGTYDDTGGQGVGATLYIDEVKLVSSGVIAHTVIEQILEQIEYLNSWDRPPTVKYYNVNLVDANGNVGQATARRINICSHTIYIPFVHAPYFP
jgi:hypothetical protein